jgi:hypothetical protein
VLINDEKIDDFPSIDIMILLFLSVNSQPTSICCLNGFLTLIVDRHRHATAGLTDNREQEKCEAFAAHSRPEIDIACCVEKSNFGDHNREETRPIHLTMLTMGKYEKLLGTERVGRCTQYRSRAKIVREIAPLGRCRDLDARANIYRQ